MMNKNAEELQAQIKNLAENLQYERAMLQDIEHEMEWRKRVIVRMEAELAKMREELEKLQGQ